ncbi:hypothetical protein ODJ79_02490 [Actinoplanes sp. KI2]|uniref:hypothetical protein n=1 Tax=Actinoplanes sp. KI2 TaxID=2983315 RepID=UPI0021D5BF6C|nr:hypothetical protein [Actinoplanes sp. KI2]MCU7722574.1 hypothetical protein [Actinoplanes sp. KI2]
MQSDELVAHQSAQIGAGQVVARGGHDRHATGRHRQIPFAAEVVGLGIRPTGGRTRCYGDFVVNVRFVR